MVLRHEVIAILFERGRFAAIDTAQTARMLMFMMPGAVAFAAQTLVVRGYYASQNTLFPAVFGTLAVIASLPVYFVAMSALGPSGIALAGALSAFVQVALLYILWNRHSNNRGSRRVYGFYGGMILMALLSGLFLEWFKNAALSGMAVSTFFGRLAMCGTIGALFLVLITAAGFALHIEEISGPIRGVFLKRSRFGKKISE
jgi:putative peptidoglycan lipid II flippase